MTRALRASLTKTMIRQKGRARPTESEAKSGRVSLKYVPRPVVEAALSTLMDHVTATWERLNDAMISMPVTSEGPQKRPVAPDEGPENLWHEASEDEK